MTPELALAVDACATDSAALVVQIVKKIREVHRFKSKCICLGQEAKTIQILLDSRKTTVDSLTTVSRIRTCLHDVDVFVESCKSMNLAAVTLEVFAKRTYPSICKQISAVKDIFLFESVIDIMKREGDARESLASMRFDLSEQFSSQRSILNDLVLRVKAQDTQRNALFASAPISSMDASLFMTGNIQMSPNDGQQQKFEAHSDRFGDVDCFRIDPRTSTEEALKTYLRFQAGAHVQRLYGLVRQESSIYAVMEKVDGSQTLADALKSGSLPRQLVDRLQLAYDIAKTMAWSHRAELLLKSVSDQSAVLKAFTSGKQYFVLTGLQSARLFLEKTSRIRYDVRYEAPEYGKLQEHTRYTDIWSLGTMFWQIVAASFPYDIETLVDSKSTSFEIIQRHLQTGSDPGSLKNVSAPPAILHLISKCWSRNPMLRPTAAEIANGIQSVIMTLVIGAEDNDTGSIFQPHLLNPTDSPNDTEDTETSHTLHLVELRRIQDVANTEPALMTEKMSEQEFEAMLSVDVWNALHYFLVGAVLFWDLVDFTKSSSPATWRNFKEGYREPLAVLSAVGQRVDVAISYLETAVAEGYEEAQFELYKAHALIARELKERSAKTIAKLKVDRKGSRS